MNCFAHRLCGEYYSRFIFKVMSLSSRTDKEGKDKRKTSITYCTEIPVVILRAIYHKSMRVVWWINFQKTNVFSRVVCVERMRSHQAASLDRISGSKPTLFEQHAFVWINMNAKQCSWTGLIGETLTIPFVKLKIDKIRYRPIQFIIRANGRAPRERCWRRRMHWNSHSIRSFSKNVCGEQIITISRSHFTFSRMQTWSRRRACASCEICSQRGQRRPRRLRRQRPSHCDTTRPPLVRMQRQRSSQKQPPFPPSLGPRRKKWGRTTKCQDRCRCRSWGIRGGKHSVDKRTKRASHAFYLSKMAITRPEEKKIKYFLGLA